MRNFSQLHYLLLLLNFLSVSTGKTQPMAKWLLGLEAGAAIYQGDVSEGGFGTLQGETLLLGGSLQYRPSAYWSFGVQGHQGKLKSSDLYYTNDAYRADRRFSFTTEATDIALIGRFMPLPKLRFRPSVGIGLGMIFFTTDAYLQGNRHLSLFEAIKEDERSTENQAFFLPVHFGFAYQISPLLSFDGGLQYNFAFTDYLDGVSFSGDANNNDRYGQLYLGLTFHLGNLSDIDEDGIADFEDQCPLKPGTARTGGCPDSDGDGIRDSEDRCPLAAGLASMEGCPDTDKDGTSDPYDRCPAQAGPPESLGCPPEDSDGDGILDHLDDCPLTVGIAARRGCPAIDSDSDGILDEDDHCPERFGLPLFDGCPDSDGDGIEDIKDACPNTVGLYDQQGCPQLKDPKEEAAMLNQQILFFRSNSADLYNFALVDKFLVFLTQNPRYHLTINGHADDTGSEQNTGYLSLLRAERIRRYLEESGVNTNQLSVRGFSGYQPLGKDATTAGQALNRRVVFVLEVF